MSRIYGRHAVAELLEGAPTAIAAVVVVAGGRLSLEDEEVVARARALAIPVRELDAVDLRRRSGGRGAVQLGADLRVASVDGLESLRGTAEGSELILALDGVTDPHNLGAVLRSAAAFGAAAVVVPRDRSAPLNDAAVRASAGGVAHVPLLRVTNLARALRQLKDQGFWTVGTVPDVGTPLWQADLDGPLVVALGAEGRGLRPNVLKACDMVLRLPLTGPVASLNVSVFAGILCAEVSRRRGA